MKPLLIVGLGNPLMGDDGVGALLAESLAQSLAGHPRAEVLIGGTDLLRCAGEIEGRERVILIDAVQSGAEREGAGEITVTDEDPPEGLSVGTHSLSAPAAVRLLRRLMPEVRFTWMLAGVRSVRAGEGLSPELAAALPRLRECLIELVAVA
jgi:hydrogenase maturation protease